MCLALSDDIVKHCCLTAGHTELHFGDEHSPLSDISYHRAEEAYDNDLFRYATKGADSEQPVGVPFNQWVDCRDHAGIACIPHFGSWQAQRGPAYICRYQRKRVFYDMGPLKISTVSADLSLSSRLFHKWGP